MSLTSDSLSPTTGSGLIVSLDLELFWGVRDHRSVAQYGQNILGVRLAIPAILELFKANQIACTWAAVGMLMAKDKKELQSFIPDVRPAYTNEKLDPYQVIDEIGDNEQSDPYHYGGSLIQLIRETPYQEIGTHTFGHYNCLETGATDESFAADLVSASAIMSHYGVRSRSIVFPRNQFNSTYIEIAAQNGFDVVRGNETSWLYKSAAKSEHSQMQRALRLADAYLNISGANAYEAVVHQPAKAVDVPASRFLRPWSAKLALADPMKLHRITTAMDYAARNGKIFHLWFHPHNFGKDLKKNMAMLSNVVKKFHQLKYRYGWISLSMGEAAKPKV